MAKKFEGILNECFERMLRGESIEACLDSYPQEAAELEPLLRTFLNVKWRASSIEPRPGFKAITRARLEGAHLYAQQQPKTGFFAWHRAWALSLTAVIIVILASASTVAAASDALPDEYLYPVKLATETARETFTFSDSSKAKLHVELAERRSQEIAAMAIDGKTVQVIMLTEKLAVHLEEAEHAIVRMEEAEIKRLTVAPQAVTAPKRSLAPETSVSPAPEQYKDGGENGSAQDESTEPQKVSVPQTEQLRQSLNIIITKNLTNLEGTLDKTPEQTKPALRKAIDLSRRNHIQTPQQTEVEIQIKPVPVKPDIIRDTSDTSQNKQPTTNNTDSEKTQVQVQQKPEVEDKGTEGENTREATTVTPDTNNDTKDNSTDNDRTSTIDSRKLLKSET